MRATAEDIQSGKLNDEYYYAHGNEKGSDTDKTYLVYVISEDVAKNAEYIKITDKGGAEIKKSGSDENARIYTVYKNIEFPDGMVLNADELTGEEGNYIVAVQLDKAVVPNTNKFEFVAVGAE